MTAPGRSVPGQPLPAPAPPVNPETKPYWDATARGQLLVTQCADCQALIWYPRAHCPECASPRTRWRPVSGRGHVYSYTVNYRGEGPYQGCGPYVLAYVELDEGPRMMTNIVEAAPEALRVGMPVHVVFHDTGEGSALPRFRPA